MKRHEMIERLTDALDNIRPQLDEQGNISYDDRRLMAEILLNIAESAGMLPPPIYDLLDMDHRDIFRWDEE